MTLTPEFGKCFIDPAPERVRVERESPAKCEFGTARTWVLQTLSKVDNKRPLWRRWSENDNPDVVTRPSRVSEPEMAEALDPASSSYN
jgi:hypothetical protein